jgi:phage tail-like protein
MPQAFPYTAYHFGVFFLFPQFSFKSTFQSVSGLNFSSVGNDGGLREGGNNGVKLPLTGTGAYAGLTLNRGFTADLGLFNWCEQTHTTMKTEPCNILVSLLDKQENPVKNWLIFNAIPTSWTAGDLSVDNGTSVMVESIKLSYQNFIFI